MLAFLVIIYSLWIYRSTFNLGFNTDAFGLIDHVRHGFVHALNWDKSYHYFPVTAAWLWVQHAVFGLNESAYQVLNILQHGIISVLVFLLALELTDKRGLALLAGVLFAGSGNFYEVTLWSIVGTNFHVSSFFYIAGLIFFIRFLRSRLQTYYWLFSICVTLALWSHESTLSLVPVCMAYYFLIHSAPIDFSRLRAKIRSECSRFMRLFYIPILITIGFLLMKGAMSLHGAVTGGPQSLTSNIYFFLRGVVGAFTLRGDGQFLGPILGLFGGIHLVWLWLIIGVFGFGSLMVFVFSPVERFLVVWALGQLLMMELAISISSRHLYLPTVATTIFISAIGYRSVKGMLSPLSKHIPTVFARASSQFLFYSIMLLVFVPPSLRDIRSAEQLWQGVHRANLSMNKAINNALSEPRHASNIYLVNLTKNAVVDGFAAWTFQNGTRQKLQMYFPDNFASVRLIHLNTTSNRANGSRLIKMEDAVAVINDPQNMVIAYNQTENNFENAKVLRWTRQGELSIPANTELTLPFQMHDDNDGECLLYVTYLNQPVRVLSIAVDNEALSGSRAARPKESPHWITEEYFFKPPSKSFNVTFKAVGQAPALVREIGLR